MNSTTSYSSNSDNLACASPVVCGKMKPAQSDLCWFHPYVGGKNRDGRKEEREEVPVG